MLICRYKWRYKHRHLYLLFGNALSISSRMLSSSQACLVIQGRIKTKQNTHTHKNKQTKKNKTKKKLRTKQDEEYKVETALGNVGYTRI